jgi:hypothetical protein
VYASFTGTRRGLTAAQRETLRRILTSPRLRIVRLTHGGAIGADAEVHEIALALTPADLPWLPGGRLEVWLRPSDRADQSAPCLGAGRVFPARPPLERNRDIVADSGLLIACPAERVEQARGGTWSTIRHARESGRADVLAVWPDGSTSSWKRPAPRAWVEPRGGAGVERDPETLEPSG